MRLTLMLVLPIVLSACSKQSTLPPLPPMDTGVAEAFDRGDLEANRQTALQRDLIAAAGNDRVFFETDAYALTPVARATLDQQAAWLRQRPEVSFTIEGHCDERGTREYNIALGSRRANAVANHFTALGITPDRIRTVSYGKERPEALGSDDASYSQNRRAVSIVFSASVR